MVREINKNFDIKKIDFNDQKVFELLSKVILLDYFNWKVLV